MKCPLLASGWSAARGGDKVYPVDCLEEECSWWDESVDRCSTVALSQTFIAIGNVLGKLADRKSINVQLAK